MASPQLIREIERRRTFAIISHPDAGKTTLTEKLLLYSGLIQSAGLVKNRKGRKATSDWMGMEQERGISITSSAMQFPYKGQMINVLDTPGHQDFSEDTYRTLTAADSAIMVLDAGKGVELQTRKLFEVCRLRGIPILTFINKLDMPGRAPLDLLTELEEALGVQACAFNWPVGSGRDFRGVVDRRANELQLFTKTAGAGAKMSALERIPVESSEFEERLGSKLADEVRGELELLDVAGNQYDHEEFLAGKITPAFFGSALTNFGLEPFFDAFVEMAPSPYARPVTKDDETEGMVEPTEEFSAFVFKIQANMDRRHRDCIAFLRICSGTFEPDTLVHHHRLNKLVRLSRPHSVVAKSRTTLDEAFAGDVVGLISRDMFHIGDTISTRGGFRHKALPMFQPELFARIAPTSTSLRKRFDKGMRNLIAEGAIQRFTPEMGADMLIGAVGRLQLEVLQYRLDDEYGVETHLTYLPYQCSAWLKDQNLEFKAPTTSLVTRDARDRIVILFLDKWEKRTAAKMNPEHTLLDFA